MKQGKTPNQAATHIILVAIAYYAGGKLGLALPYMDGEISSNITLFWPPTGVAFAALLIWGFACWPGIFLGSVAVNLTTGDLSVPIALGIGIGNTLAPVCGAFLLERVTRFHASFLRGRDAVSFMLIASGSMLVSATGGIISLYVGGKLALGSMLQAWFGWWLGDTVGVLIFSPLLLLWASRRLDSLDIIIRSPRLRNEFAVVMGSCALMTWLVFGETWALGQLNLSLAFLVFLPLIWAGFRFDALGSSISTLIVSLIAVRSTAQGMGPFAGGDAPLHQLVLCIFITTVSLVSLVIIVLQAARRQSEQTIKDSESRLRLAMEDFRASEKLQRELRTLAEREQSRMRALLSAMNIGILFEDNERRVEYVNPAFLQMLGVDEQTGLVGTPTRAVLEQSSKYSAHPAQASKDILVDENGERLELDLSNGRTLTRISHSVTDAEGHGLGRLWIYEDITNERQAAQQLVFMAERDPLTGLYNRHRFQQQLENLIASSIRNQTRFALLYFDLDDFKYINDTFGHRAGDMVLVRAAGEISSIVRHIEIFARLGGDEFAILSMIRQGDDITALPARVVAAIASIPLQLRNTGVHLTSSVGVAAFPDHGETAEDLVAHADAAMYQAKNLGKNTWTIYDPSRDSSRAMVHHMSWHNRIAQALEKNLFELHFQGIFQASQCTLNHLEVLIRMRDPYDPDNLIMPGQFIPVAEKSKQILNIDRWVIKRSIQLLSCNPRLLPLAVNISGRSFDEPTLPQFIRNQLGEWNVNANRLIIELTETAAVSDIQDAQRFIEAIRQTGCQVCLDDFGSGFSTFGYLKYLNVEILKIDGLFIRDLPNNRDNQIFVKAMVEVARGLGKTMVAEFVEDAATLEMVRSLGVDMVQGYYLDQPKAHIPAQLQLDESAPEPC